MHIFSIIAVFFVIWWVCFIMVLPMGIRSQAEVGEVVAGTEPGAPALFRMWPKLLINTAVSVVMTGLLFWAISNPVLQAYWG